MLTLTDMFCGAGGSSTGALSVPGVEVKVATNHWDLAIETHNTNHQDADHVLADVSQIHPRYFPHSDILWASPECTNHSQAKGVKRQLQAESLFDKPDQAAERSRATMWDVPRFAEHHKYRLIITENVIDVRKWVMWDAWIMAMDSLGYDHHVVYMNSMHAQAFGLPAPQSRDRMYVIFWRKGNRRPDFDRLRPQAYCSHCDEMVTAVQVFKKEPRWGRYRAQYVWRCPSVSCRNAVVEPGWLPASSVIDWSLPTERIGDRKKPLAVKTMKRIEAGLRKYIEPMIVNNVSGADESRSTRLSEPSPTFVAGGLHASLLVPVEGRDGKDARSVAEAMRTQTTRNETAFVHLPMLHLEAAGNTYDSANPRRGGDYYRIWPDTEPFRTMHTTESKGIVVPQGAELAGRPFLTQFRERVRDIDPQREPLPTVVSEGANHGVIIPLRKNNTPKPLTDPLDTFAAAGNHHGLATAEPVSVGPINVDDCLFRMLSPHEIMLGMAFPDEYLLLGNKREKVRMAGNAVTPPAARDLIRVAVASLLEEAT